MMRRGCLDFITGRPVDLMTFFNERIDIHHIFPQDWCKKRGIPQGKYNSIMNKTPVSADSNSAIGGDAPPVYLRRIEKKHSLPSGKLDSVLRSHLIAPEHLRNDDFEAFYEERMRALADVIANAMEKAVVQEHGKDENESDIVTLDDADDAMEAA